MVTLTRSARAVIRKLRFQPGHSFRSGLRIALGARGGDGLQVGAADRPEPGDRVVEDGDARLFLGPVAVRRLAGRGLDVQKDGRGRLHFSLVRRPERQGRPNGVLCSGRRRHVPDS